MDDATKRRLYTKSELAGVPLSEALRNGAEAYLDNILEATDQPAQAETQGDDDPDQVLQDFRDAAAKVERLFRGR